MANIVMDSDITAISYPNRDDTYHRTTIADYNQKYPSISFSLMFFSFSFLGWLWEVGLRFFMTGAVVNRGVLHGPWLPIYGVGGLSMLILLKRFHGRPFSCFWMSVVVCGAIEFSTSWVLEKFLHASWWNYSSKFMNLQGRIYLQGLLFFGAAGCLIIYVIAPLINQKLFTVSRKKKIILCVVAGLLFIADLIFSMVTPNMGSGISQIIYY